MEDLKLHRAEIDREVTDLYFAMYMQGEWGVIVGYVPNSIANTRKTLLDWQEHNDCCALAEASLGSYVYTCCSRGIALTYTDIINCCIPPATVNPIDGKCYFPGSGIPVFPDPCPYCPTGYINNPISGFCVGPNGELAQASFKGDIQCVTTTNGGKFGPPVSKCPNRVYPFTILQYATLPTNPQPCSPYQPLCSGGFYKPCLVR